MRFYTGSYTRMGGPGVGVCRWENDQLSLINAYHDLNDTTFVILSGETGSGKTALMRDLANALGLTAQGKKRCAMLNGSLESPRASAALRALTQEEDLETLRLLMVDDANAVPGVNQSSDLIGWFEENASASSLSH